MHIGGLAHAGEELLFVLLPVLVFLGVYMVRTRRAARHAADVGEGGRRAGTDGDPPA